jgi:hypothetical protein
MLNIAILNESKILPKAVSLVVTACGEPIPVDLC